MTLPQERIYTTDDIYNLPDGERAELIDGQIYYMAPPTRRHQLIAGNLFTIINTYIKSRGGSCEPYIAPFAVFLNADDKNYVEPDISVICDKSKLTDKRLQWCARLDHRNSISFQPKNGLHYKDKSVHGCRSKGILDCRPAAGNGTGLLLFCRMGSDIF